MAETPAPLVDAAAFNRIVSAKPWFGTWAGCRATEIRHGYARLTMPVRPEFLREGGSVSGPMVMLIADMAMYAVAMSVSPDGERAVTAEMTMHFLRRPKGEALIGEAAMLRRGRRLIVCEANVYVDGARESVCHVVGSYAPPA